ncbi:MAG: YIP1 family protein [Sphingobacterium sp.]|nr:YIP1 family protein [Sphingobacterium sp.]
MNRFFRNYARTAVRPTAAFTNVLGGDYVREGFLYMSIPLVLYTLMYVLLNLGGGAPSTFTPWLNIPKERYYFYNQFLLAPSLVLAWFAAAALVQVLARAFRGKGTFEQTLSILGLSTSVAMWGTLFHDLLMSFFSAVRVIDARQHEIAMNTPTVWRTVLWICFAVYFGAFFVLYSKSVRVVHGLSVAGSALIGSAGFVLFQLIFVIFNR